MTLILLRYKPLVATAALLALSACEAPADPTTETAMEEQNKESEQESDNPGDLPDFARSAWLTIGVDGAVQTTFFDIEGRYRDLRNGALVAEGGWEERPEGTICFDPDTGRGGCWTITATEDDSTLIATNEQDKRVELKQLAYIPPANFETVAEAD